MELRFTPSFFYGSAAAALMGLSLGVALHGPWESKAGGPRMMFASAAAAEPADDGELVDASYAAAPDAYVYDGSLPADPLPVTRLKPDRYPNLWSDGQVTQASVDQGERVNPDDLYKADIFADETPAADDELPPPDQTPRVPVRYSALDAAESNPSF